MFVANLIEDEVIIRPQIVQGKDGGDLGISIDTAVEVAKASADLILLHKDLKVLRRSIREGRMVFGNIVKYLKMAASSNFGNALSVTCLQTINLFLDIFPGVLQEQSSR